MEGNVEGKMDKGRGKLRQEKKRRKSERKEGKGRTPNG